MSVESIYDEWLRTDFYPRNKPWRYFLTSLIWFPLLGLRIQTERADDDEPQAEPEPEPTFVPPTELPDWMQLTQEP